MLVLRQRERQQAALPVQELPTDHHRRSRTRAHPTLGLLAAAHRPRTYQAGAVAQEQQGRMALVKPVALLHRHHKVAAVVVVALTADRAPQEQPDRVRRAAQEAMAARARAAVAAALPRAIRDQMAVAAKVLMVVLLQ